MARKIEYNGKLYTLKQIIDNKSINIHGLTYQAVLGRINRGYSLHLAINTPRQPAGRKGESENDFVNDEYLTDEACNALMRGSVEDLLKVEKLRK